MKLLHPLWADETGAVVSAELVLLGTLGVLGATVGLNAASTALHEELLDVAFALRSLDQSYHVPGHAACGAWTAGSTYRQQDVAISLEELRSSVDENASNENHPVEPSASEDDRHRPSIDGPAPFSEAPVREFGHPAFRQNISAPATTF